MPGSRKAEIEHHLDVQLKVAERLYQKDQTLRFALLTAPGLSKQYLQDSLPRINIPLTIIKDEPFEMIHIVDAVLAASGTATLFVGLLKKPMVIMYIMKPVTAFLAKLIVRSTPFFGIVNLILNKEVSRELFQQEANVDNLTVEMEKIIFDNKLRDQQINNLALLTNKLGHSGVTEKVAKTFEDMIQ
jgi:lipid-A-disaccharide synthase